MPDLSQHACFDCRKVFKKPHHYGLNGPVYPCPECGMDMTYMGYKFRAPGKKDIKKWKWIKECEENGVDWEIKTIRKEDKIAPQKLSNELKKALGVTKRRA